MNVRLLCTTSLVSLAASCALETSNALEERTQPILSSQKIADLIARVNKGSSSEPQRYVMVGSSYALMFTNSGVLFRTDGTPGGTLHVSDLAAPPKPGTPYAVFRGAAYWLGTDGALWASQGDGGRTQWLWPPSSTASALPPFATDQALYFSADSKLYRLDVGATEPLIASNLVQVGPGFALGTRAYFQCLGAQGEMAVCVTEGPGVATRVLANLAPAGNSTPRMLGAYNDKVWFSRSRDAQGPRGMWTVDVTTAAVTEVVAPGTADVTPADASFAMLGGLVYFPCVTAAGYELCRSDGTAAGTTVLDLNPGSASSIPAVVSTGTQLILRAYQPATGLELYRSDGTVAGTTLIADLAPGAAPGVFESRLVVVGDTVYFAAVGADQRSELAKTDGTSAGTTRIFSIGLGHFTMVGTMLQESVAVGDKLVFSGGTVRDDLEPWVSDGTRQGTYLLKDLAYEYERFSGAQAFRVGDRHCLLFSTLYNGTYVTGTSGTASDTRSVGLNARLPAATDSALYSFGGVPEALHKTDCATEGTRVRALPSEVTSSATLGERLAFTDVTGALWFSDGTSAGTNASTTWTASHVERAGDKLWLRSADRLLASDGTEATTKEVSQLSQVRAMRSFTALGSVTVFVVDDAIRGAELWRTDGTANGTTLLADLATGTRSSNPRFFSVLGSELLFTADVKAGAPAQLWKTNGTVEGTQLVRDIEPVGPATVWGPYAFLPVNSYNGRELWRTDGTAVGTGEIEDLFFGPQSSNPGSFFLAGERGPLFFAAEVASRGRELWMLPTPTGKAELAVDFNATSVSSNPVALFTRGSSAFVFAVSEELATLMAVRLPPETVLEEVGEDGCGCSTRAPWRQGLLPIVLALLGSVLLRRRRRS